MARVGLDIMQPQQQAMAGRVGGGGLGQQLGLLAGAGIGYMAAPVVAPAVAPTLGAALGGALTGAATGAGLGSLLGEAVKPSQQATMGQRAQMAQPQLVHSEQSNALRDSLVALKDAPDDVQTKYAPILTAGYVKSVIHDNAQPQDQGVMS